VVAEIARAAGHRVVGFIDADERMRGRIIDTAGARVILNEVELIACLRNGWPLPSGVDGIIPAVEDNSTRMDQVRLLGPLLPPALVHPTATVSPTATVRDGAVVGPLAAINSGARVGRGAIISTGVVLEHDTVVEACAHVSSRAVLTGAAHLGARSLVGAGALVLPSVVIGADALVSPGAVVISNLPDGCRAVGVPARPLKEHPRVEE
jgi:UDP-3-O-[3-hydroxymyristoyl] glucosamine N-acyltransferase